MNEHSHPIEFLIEFAWANGADRFIVNNAKDELKKLRLSNLENNPVAWAKTNIHGDLFDLRTQNNPYNDQKTIIPLYRKSNDK